MTDLGCTIKYNLSKGIERRENERHPKTVVTGFTMRMNSAHTELDLSRGNMKASKKT